MVFSPSERSTVEFPRQACFDFENFFCIKYAIHGNKKKVHTLMAYKFRLVFIFIQCFDNLIC